MRQVPEPREPVDLIPYKIVEDDSWGNIKRTVEVLLPGRISEADLRTVAEKIIGGAATSYDRTFIMHRIPGMPPGSAAWATTHKNPDLEVSILGTTEEEAAFLKSAPPPVGEVLGMWFDDRPFVGQRISLVRRGEELFLIRLHKSGGSGDPEPVQKIAPVPGQRLCVAADNDFGEYYAIDAGGMLEIHDRDGLVARFREM